MRRILAFVAILFLVNVAWAGLPESPSGGVGQQASGTTTAVTQSGAWTVGATQKRRLAGDAHAARCIDHDVDVVDSRLHLWATDRQQRTCRVDHQPLVLYADLGGAIPRIRLISNDTTFDGVGECDGSD